MFERGPVNMVKVKLIERNPKYIPYVLAEDTLGHDLIILLNIISQR